MNNPEDRERVSREDLRSTTELIDLALSNDIDEDGDEYWNLIGALQYRLPRIEDQIEELSGSSDPKSREIAATILGQNRVKEKVLIDACVEMLARMLNQETTSEVLVSIAFAVGQFHTEGALELLLELACHYDADVRFAVTTGLCGREDDRSIKMLISLSEDQDSDVRNWATFGLGSQIEADTPEIRNALVARLDEEDDEIRGEAYTGLAERGDDRMIRPYLTELQALEPAGLNQWSPVFDAGYAIMRRIEKSPNTKWLPILEKIDSFNLLEKSELQTAIARCKQTVRTSI